jgi:hypothetical protein
VCFQRLHYAQVYLNAWPWQTWLRPPAAQMRNRLTSPLTCHKNSLYPTASPDFSNIT